VDRHRYKKEIFKLLVKMREKKANRCLILNSHNLNLRIINKYVNNKYKIFCVNNESIIFCLKNNIKFYFFEDLLKTEERSNILKKIEKIWRDLLLAEQEKNEIYEIIEKDYYSLHYFFLSYVQGIYFSKQAYFKNLSKLVYYGENFKNIDFFRYYSPNQNLVLLNTFFSNLRIKPKLNFSQKAYNNKQKIFSFITKPISILNELIYKIKLIFTKSNTIVFLKSGEIHRYKFLSKKFPIFCLDINNYNYKKKIEYISNKNILYSNFFLKNNKNETSQINLAYNKFLENTKNKNIIISKKFNLFFFKYFNYRLKQLVETKKALKKIFINKKINTIFISNLWDIESYMPVLSFDRLNKIYLLPHSTTYPTFNFKENCYFIYSHRIQKKFQPKNLRFKRMKLQYIYDEYQTSNNNKIKISPNKKNILFLSQGLPPGNQAISVFFKKSSFYKNLELINKIEKKYNEKIQFFVKLHPSINNSNFIEDLQKVFCNLIFIQEQISYDFMKQNFNTFILAEFPVKIGLSLLIDKKNFFYLDVNLNEKFLKNKINFNEILKNKKITKLNLKKNFAKILN
jgi:hypothetical protein